MTPPLQDMVPQNIAPQDMAAYLACAHRLADLSAAEIVPHFRQALTVEDKSAGAGSIPGGGRYDPVTAADRAAETVIRAELGRAFPEHGILGEEFASTPSPSPLRWIIDPIDGTRAFIIGLPLWGTLIGLAHAGTPILGVMNQPFTAERFWSEGEAAFWSGPDSSLPQRPRVKRRLATRTCPQLDQAILASTHPELFGPGFEADRFQTLKTRVRMTRYGGDCYAYCMVAMGLLDLVVEAGLKAYDIAALVPIIEKAGGRVTGWAGEPPLDSAGGRIVAAGDPALHATVLKLLN